MKCLYGIRLRPLLILHTQKSKQSRNGHITIENIILVDHCSNALRVGTRKTENDTNSRAKNRH